MKNLVLLLSIFFLPLSSRADSYSPEVVVHLLDYLAKDYGGAVQGGSVISKSEYAEQVEFGGIVAKNAKGVERLNSNPAFIKGVLDLQVLIRSKSSAEDVSKLARTLQQQAIQLANIAVAPTTKPDLALGRKLFQANCVSCHGVEGHGDGIAGAALDPKPANFHDAELVWNSAPYKFYNTIRLGVPGTGMVSFSQLTDQEVWALAFFLKSLPYARPASTPPTPISLADISTLTDAEIAERLGVKKEAAAAVIGSIRNASDSPDNHDPLRVADDFLNESIDHAKKGDYQKASTAALKGYLEGIEPVEPKMKANLPGAVENIEVMMASYRSALNAKEPIENLVLIKEKISARLSEIRSAFSQNQMSAGVAFGAAFSIFLREGFEAVLIIIVLISIMRAMGQTNAIKWIHFGWASAVLLGVAGWFASGLLMAMSGMSRELLEGSISILAVIVLLYVGFWLHRYSEMKKWHAFLESKLRNGMGQGNYLALAVVAFMAVFREAFEVVLFLRAIWMDLGDSGQNAVGAGVATSFVLLMGISVLAIRESRKLPLGLLFRICSWTMVILAFILAGKGVHSLQEAGFIEVYSLFLPRFDIIGLYPSAQTLMAQFVVVTLIAMLFLNERRVKTATNTG